MLFYLYHLKIIFLLISNINNLLDLVNYNNLEINTLLYNILYLL